MAATDRFSTTFLDMTQEDLGVLKHPVGPATADAEGGFDDSFVGPPPQGGAAPSTTATVTATVHYESTNPFSAQFVPSSTLQETPAQLSGSGTLSQEGHFGGSGSDVGSSVASPVKSSHSQEVTVVVEMNNDDRVGSRTPDTLGEFESELSAQTSSSVPQATAEIGFDTSDTPPPSLNGIVEQQSKSPSPAPQPIPKKNWEKFEDAPKEIQKKLSVGQDGHGAVCATDAMFSELQWTALEDSHLAEHLEESDDSTNLPFRKTQSMRATSNRKIEIVDALKQRRLSNLSLDRMVPTTFVNEDELTKKFSLDRSWQVFVKLDRRVKGTRSVPLYLHNPNILSYAQKVK